MNKLRKINWEIFKESFLRPKFIIISLVMTLIIGFGLTTYSIYTKDEPSFIPENFRDEVRGAIIEKIGQPLQSISNPAGTFIIDAAYDKSKAYAYGKDDTKNWPTYTDEDSGISVKYPEDWSMVESDFGIKFFIKDENLIKFEELNNLEGDDKDLFWGSIGIGFEVELVGHVSIDDFIDNQLGLNGIHKDYLNIKDRVGIKAIDESEDRYGGGIGYYYFIGVGERIVTVSLDYFGTQSVDEEMIMYLEKIALTVK